MFVVQNCMQTACSRAQGGVRTSFQRHNNGERLRSKHEEKGPEYKLRPYLQRMGQTLFDSETQNIDSSGLNM